MTDINGGIAAIHARYFEQLERVEHREVAIAAALDYCAEHFLTPPIWVVQEAAPVLLKLLKEQRPKRLGRNAGHLARYRQDMIDIKRWDAVKVVREKQAYFEHEYKLALSWKGVSLRYKADIEKAHIWSGTTWDRAYECASMYLRGSDAYAGVDSIKASYLKVNRSGKSKAKGNRYLILDQHFLNKIATPPRDPKQGRKIGALFDLTM